MGRWEVLFETRDESEWHTHIRRLQASDTQIDWTAVRVDRLCGRLTQPTTFRLSLFVPNAMPDPDQDSSVCSGTRVARRLERPRASLGGNPPELALLLCPRQDSNLRHPL